MSAVTGRGDGSPILVRRPQIHRRADRCIWAPVDPPETAAAFHEPKP